MLPRPRRLPSLATLRPVDGVRVEPMRPDDWAAVRRIFEDGIATGDATFETAAPSWEEWDGAHLPHSRLVARLGDDVVGWAALAPTSTRRVYRGVAELSVYVADGARGRGIGTALLHELIRSAEAEGIWTLQTGIFPENTVSVRLHERCGFRVVGLRSRLGRMHGRWRDVLLMERRSDAVGT